MIFQQFLGLKNNTVIFVAFRWLFKHCLLFYSTPELLLNFCSETVGFLEYIKFKFIWQIQPSCP